VITRPDTTNPSPISARGRLDVPVKGSEEPLVSLAAAPAESGAEASAEMLATADVPTLALGGVEVLGPDDSEVTPPTTVAEVVGVVLSVEGAEVVGVDTADASPHVTFVVVCACRAPSNVHVASTSTAAASPCIATVSAEMSMLVEAVVESTTTSRDVDPNPATSIVTCTDTPFGGKPDQLINTRSQDAVALSREWADDGAANANRKNGTESPAGRRAMTLLRCAPEVGVIIAASLINEPPCQLTTMYSLPVIIGNQST